MARENTKRKGRVLSGDVYLLDVRTYLIGDLIARGFSNKNIAFIFNVHPSQITRALKK